MTWYIYSTEHSISCLTNIAWKISEVCSLSAYQGRYWINHKLIGHSNYRKKDNHTLQWHRNERDCVSKHRRPDCLLGRLCQGKIKENIKDRRHWPVTGGFPLQRANKAENGSIWWRHPDKFHAYYDSPHLRWWLHLQILRHHVPWIQSWRKWQIRRRNWCHSSRKVQWRHACNGPLARYVKLQVAHAPGMPGTFSPAADFKGNC